MQCHNGQPIGIAITLSNGTIADPLRPPLLPKWGFQIHHAGPTSRRVLPPCEYDRRSLLSSIIFARWQHVSQSWSYVWCICKVSFAYERCHILANYFGRCLLACQLHWLNGKVPDGNGERLCVI